MYHQLLEDLLKINPYSLEKGDKDKFFPKIIQELSIHHYENCENYRNIIDRVYSKNFTHKKLSDFPYLPAELFKEIELLSIDKKNIFKVLTSSGTSTQTLSKIYLDRFTSSLQTKVLYKIMNSILGNRRLPMLVIDSPNTIKNRSSFSARAAGILGFSFFGKDITYALDENMRINHKEVNNFLEKYKNQKIFIFGFTFMVWKHFILELQKIDKKIDFRSSILLHGGGWKKLKNLNISNEEFKTKIKFLLNIDDVIDYYGMVEQTGTIYTECKEGYLHTSIFSEIIIRDHIKLTPLDDGEKGIIQVLSIAPFSYPGHSLLTNDEGILIGEDNCKCGKKGKYFKVLGRVKNSAIRGCSDTYQG